MRIGVDYSRESRFEERNLSETFSSQSPKNTARIDRSQRAPQAEARSGGQASRNGINAMFKLQGRTQPPQI